LGVKCKDGVILGAEKLVVSKLMVPGSNKRLYNIDKEIGCVR
jgi:20S proteasome subunit alpha 7